MLFDLSSSLQDFPIPPQADIRRRDVVEWLVITLVVVVINESADPTLQLLRGVIVFRQDDVLH